MAVKDKSIREAQIAFYGNAVAKRYALLKEKGEEASIIEKDPVLKHLKAELSRRRRRLLAIAGKVKPKPAAVMEQPPKEEEKPKEKSKKKEKTKKAESE
jgi:phage gp29-like protein